MARVAYLKETLFHSDTLFSGSKVLDVYDNKDGFGGEQALCVQLKTGNIGYIPLTNNNKRISSIKTIGKDGQSYALAVQKKCIYDDIAYCLIRTKKYNEKYITVGENYVQAYVSGVSDSGNCYMDIEFYNSQDENITKYANYVEDNVSVNFLINAYLTFSGYGNNYNFQYNQTEILGNIGSYTNKDLNVTTTFDTTTKLETKRFFINAVTPNTGNSALTKITFKSLTINGRLVPIRIS